MLYKYYLAIVLMFLLSMPYCLAQDDLQAKKDSLLNVIATSQGQSKLDAYQKLCDFIFFHQPIDTTIKYLDIYEKEARQQKSIKDEGWARASANSAFLNAGRYEGVIKRIDDDLAFFAKHEFWSTYYDNYKRLAKAYSFSGQKDKALQVTKEMYDQAKKNNHPDGISTALLQMGELYQRMERIEKAIESFSECLAMERKSDKVNRTRLSAYFYLAGSNTAIRRFDEALAFLKEYEADLKKREEQTGIKEPTFWGDLYKTYLHLYITKEEWEKVEPYCRLLDGLSNAIQNKSVIANYRARAFMVKKEYQKALEQVEIYYDISRKMQDPHAIAQAFKLKSYLLAYLGKPDETKQAIDSLLSARRTLYNLEINAQLDELRTQYEVDRHIAEKEKTRNYLLFALAVCLLLAIALGIWIYFNRKIVKKNHSLYRQIQALLQKEKETEQKLLNAPEEELSRDLLLFRQLSELVQKEKIFTEADLNRKKIADRLNTNEIYLADAIREVTGETLSTYISNLRLQYTLELLKEHPNMTFDTIAVESGHGSYSSFFRSFTKKYGITPSEYRKLATDDNNT